jgi:hypothetical protein
MLLCTLRMIPNRTSFLPSNIHRVTQTPSQQSWQLRLELTVLHKLLWDPKIPHWHPQSKLRSELPRQRITAEWSGVLEEVFFDTDMARWNSGWSWSCRPLDSDAEKGKYIENATPSTSMVGELMNGSSQTKFCTPEGTASLNMLRLRPNVSLAAIRGTPDTNAYT